MNSRSSCVRYGLEIISASIVVLGTFAATAGASFPGRNGVIAFESRDQLGGTDVEAIHPSTGAMRTIIRDGRSPAWSADGKRLTFVRAGAVWVAGADGSRQKRLTSGGDDRAPAWAPDGRRLVFVRDGRLWVVRSNGKRELPLGAPGDDPTWSPDGRRIAYTNELAAWRMNGDGTERKLLASQIHFAQDPADVSWYPDSPDWSPDGRQVVLQYTYGGPCDGCFQLLRVAAAGGPPVKLAGSDSLGAPSWSPDGAEIAAQAVEGLGTVASTRGAAAHYLLTGEFFDYTFPAWQPLRR